MCDPQPGPAAQNPITLYVGGLREAKGLLPKHTRLEALVLRHLYSKARKHIYGRKRTFGTLMARCWCRSAAGGINLAGYAGDC